MNRGSKIRILRVWASLLLLSGYAGTPDSRGIRSDDGTPDSQSRSESAAPATLPIAAPLLKEAVRTLSSGILNTLSTTQSLRIAVMPITELDGKQSTRGLYLTEQLTNELAGVRDSLEVLERTKISDVLREFKTATTGLLSQETIQTLGRALGADAVVVGSVADLRKEVDVTVRLIDVESFKVLAKAGALIPKEMVPPSDYPESTESGKGPGPVGQSDFDNATLDGWTPYKTAIENPMSGGNGGGSRNGCLTVTRDVGGPTGYFVAPSSYNGDWSNVAALQMDLRSSGGKYYTTGHAMVGDVMLYNGATYAWRLLPNRPPSSWQRFVVPLSSEAGMWNLGGGATSLKDILKNVTCFRIRAEYGVGKDECGLDNVKLIWRD